MSWIKDETSFYKWTAGVLGEYPISVEQFNTVSNLMAFTALDENNEVIGYQFVSLGKMTDFIKKGDDPNTAWEKASGSYGRVKPEQGAVKIIDPRKE